MTDRPARLEGFAREQLIRGKGAWSIMHDLVNIGHVEKEEARAIIGRAWPAVQSQYLRRCRKIIWVGILILAIPCAAVASFLIAMAPSFEGVLVILLVPPISFPSLVGLALVAYGASAIKRAKTASSPDLSGLTVSGPVRTGLGWRAEPFDWK